jgi:polar amino acid transport system substrate-binding protein
MTSISHGNRRKHVKALTVAIVALALLALSACGASSTGSGGSGSAQKILDNFKKDGVRVAVVEELPTASADSTLTGLVPELVEMVLKELGVTKFTAVPMDFGSQIPSLQAGRVDVAAGGFYVKPERCKAISMADPAYYYLDGFAVAKGNPHGITGYKEIASQKLKMGAVTGSANGSLAEADGVAASKISEYPDLPTLLDALKAGRIDAAPYDNVSIAYELNKPAYSDLTATTPTAPIVNGKPTPYSVSVGFAKKYAAFTKLFNAKQAEMFKAGKFDALMTKWGQDESVLRPSDIVDIKVACGQ